MKGILIIKKEHMKRGPIIPICDCIEEDAKVGDEVTLEVKGTLAKHGGQRIVEVTEINGEPVEDMHTEESEAPDLEMDAEEALMDFVKKLK